MSSKDFFEVNKGYSKKVFLEIYPTPLLHLFCTARDSFIMALNLDSTCHRQVFGVGRSEDNEVFIPDISVSRFHADISYSKGNWTIEDKNSSNGVFINKERLPLGQRTDLDANEKSIRLGFGDQIVCFFCTADQVFTHFFLKNLSRNHKSGKIPVSSTTDTTAKNTIPKSEEIEQWKRKMRV